VSINIVSYVIETCYIKFQVFTAVLMKSITFWDIMLRSPLKVSQNFGAIYHLHLQGRKISRARNDVDFQQTKRRYISQDSTPQACYIFSEHLLFIVT
jgi:hypothetical protein